MCYLRDKKLPQGATAGGILEMSLEISIVDRSTTKLIWGITSSKHGQLIYHG
jgi:hypothetical protein